LFDLTGDDAVFSMSPDERWLYVTLEHSESDIWMLTFE
jgi:hypothetical protein